MSKGIPRRSFLKLLWFGLIDLVLLAIGGVGYGVWVEPKLFQLEQVRLKLKRLPRAFSGLRIAQLSDIHMGGWMNPDRLTQVVEQIRLQQPDLLLLTGDFVVGHNFTAASRHSLTDLRVVLAPLAASVPSFASLGNHDYWADVNAVREMLTDSGVTVLENKVFTITRAGENLHICGVDDIWEGDVHLDQILNVLNDNSAAILMSHEPDFADISAATGKFDLQVSGHTHGGQIVLPLIGAPILPYLGWKYPNGLYQIGEMYQYTNRGIGMARLPVRINCPPEITLFILESTDS